WGADRVRTGKNERREMIGGEQAFESGGEERERIDGDRLDDLFFTLEIDVDPTSGNARLGKDVLHGGGVEALAHEAAAGGVEDALALGGAVLGSDSGHFAIIKRMLIL